MEPRQIAILAHLARRPDVLYTRDNLLDVIESEAFPHVIDAHVSNLRSRLRRADPEAGAIIETVYGGGYRLDPTACQ